MCIQYIYIYIHTHTHIYNFICVCIYSVYIYIYIYIYGERERWICSSSVKASSMCSNDTPLNGQLLFVAVTIPLFTHNLAVGSPLAGANGDISDCIL